MRIVLISFHTDVLSVGTRTLSACLKRAGHEVRLIFLPEPLIHGRNANTQFLRRAYRGEYDASVLQQIVDLCRDAQLIGVSLLSNYFFGAITITQALKKELETPVIWGGPHPTANPESCIAYADMVCVGEGEEAITELAERLSRGEPYDQIMNLWVRQNGQVIRNAPRPLNQNLNTVPIPDCDLIGQYILDGQEVVRVDADLIRRYTVYKAGAQGGVSYLVLTSRGCPHNCAYCGNNMWRRIYDGQRYLRRRSVENVCDELELAIARIPDIKAITFADDNFTAMPIDQLSAFLETYRRRIGLPFSCTLSAVFCDEQRVKMLLDAGVYRISLGIQTGSPRILELYQRRVSLESVGKAIPVLERCRPLMLEPRDVKYHYIIDNPYETPEDKIATFTHVLDHIPRRESVLFFSLVPFPGTAIHDKMQQDGLLVHEDEQIYHKDVFDSQAGFAGQWVRMYRGGIPDSVLRALLKPRLIQVMDAGRPRWLFGALYWSLDQGYHLLGGGKRLLGRAVRALVKTRSKLEMAS